MNQNLYFFYILFIFLIINVSSVSALDGSGSNTDPYNISTCLDLQNMSLDLTAYYQLVNEVDCSDTVNWNDGAGFDPIGDNTNRFYGCLSGSNHTISNLFINRSGESYIGLFGYTGFQTNISNLGIKDCNITGLLYVGCMVGRNNGTITQSYTTGDVGGGRYRGGFVGYNINRSNISDCYSTCNINGVLNFTGGFVGSNSGRITNSYSTGNLSGNSQEVNGGFVGSYTQGTTSPISFIINCFSTGFISLNPSIDKSGGFVGFKSCQDQFCLLNDVWYNWTNDNVTDCYFDTAGNNEYCTAIDEGGLSYFYDVSNSPMSSWDFVNVWSSVNNDIDYPHLLWEDTTTTTTTTTTDTTTTTITLSYNWNLDDCYAYYTTLFQGENTTIYSDVYVFVDTNLNLSIMLNDSEVCRYEYAYNGTIPCEIVTNSLLGNYSILCNLTDGISYDELNGGYLIVFDALTTTTTTLISNTTTTTIFNSGKRYLNLYNDNMNYQICYWNTTNCFLPNESYDISNNHDYIVYVNTQSMDIFTIEGIKKNIVPLLEKISIILIIVLVIITFYKNISQIIRHE